MKRSELFFSFLLVPFDFLMIILAGLSAYYIRYADFFQELRPVIFDLDFKEYLKFLILIPSPVFLFYDKFAGIRH